jgi:hypothetical protein
MADIDVARLEMRLAGIENRIEINYDFIDRGLVRSYVAETALAYVIAGKPLDFDKIEEIMVTELGDGQKRTQRVRDAVRELKARVADPTVAQPD